MSSSKSLGSTPSSLHAWTGRALSFLGLMILLATWSSDSIAVPLTAYRVTGSSLAAMGGLLFLLGFARAYLPMGLCFSILTFSFLMTLSFVFLSRPPERGDQAISFAPGIVIAPSKTWLGEDEWIELGSEYKYPVGQVNLPNQSAKHHSPEFDVTYSIDKTGCRAVPDSNKDAEHRVVIVGCSFTFGAGVEDHQTYVNLLTRDALRNFRVIDRGTNGWGTTQASIVVEEELTSESKPTAVVYAMIRDHLRRNYLRKSWHHRVGSMAFPLFDRQGKFIDMIDPAKGLHAPFKFMEDGPDIDAAEVEVTRALLSRMQRRANENGVPFAVVLICGPLDDRLRSATDVPGLHFIPLHHACDDIYLHDRHPTARGHRRIADAMMSSKELADALHLPELYRPARDIDPSDLQPYAVSEAFDISAKTQLRMVPLNDGKQGVRFEGIRSPSQQAASLTVARRIDPIVRNGDYQVVFSLKADAPHRLVGVKVARRVGPFESLSNVAWMRGSQTAREVSVFFRSARNDSYPALNFQLGSSSEAIEVSDVRVLPLMPSEYLLPTLHLERPEETHVWSRAVTQDNNPYCLRVEEIEVPSGEIWHSQIRAFVGAVEANQTYRFIGNMTSDEPKKILIGLADFDGEYREIAWFQEFSIDSNSAAQELVFNTRAASPQATIVINIGANNAPIEVSNLRFASEPLKKKE